MKVINTIIILMFAAIATNAQNLLRAPQKIVIDKAHSRYLISNYTTGDIIQVDSLGNQSYFVRGANFIDGLEIVGDAVYGVGHNRSVRGYNLTTKELIADLTLTGSNDNYLSSITSDSSGNLLVSCPSLHTIYKVSISNQAYWIFVENDRLNRPNGIFLEKEKDRIVVIDDSPNTSNINAISLSDSTVTLLMTSSLNNPDGIVRDKEGFYYVGGYYLPGIYKFNPDFSGEPELFFTGTNMVYPTYNEDNNSLLITYFSEDDWEEIPVTFVFVEQKR